MAVAPDTLGMVCRTHPSRQQDRDQCAARAWTLINMLTPILGRGCWRGNGRFFNRIMNAPTQEEISGILTQSLRADNHQPIVEFGWEGIFLHAFSENEKEDFTKIVITGGSVSGNGASIKLRKNLNADYAANLGSLLALIEAFEPYNSSVASRRYGDRPYSPHVPFDWMVYLGDTIIPPETLPMVHSVERVGSGTLVVLKKERLYLDRPDDLALLDAVEPIIRSYPAAALVV